MTTMYCNQGLLEEMEKLYREILTFFGQSSPGKRIGEILDVTKLKLICWTQDDKLIADGLAYVKDLTQDLHRFYPWFLAKDLMVML